jgi:GTP pyrophosphokinase
MCKTSGARNKNRQWFKKEKRDENIERGKDEFEKELKRNGILISEFLKDEIKTPVLNRFSTKTVEDLYASIGYGGISINKVYIKNIK